MSNVETILHTHQGVHRNPKGLLNSRIHAAPIAFASEPPYAVGIVDLANGVRVACRLPESESVALEPGIPVEMLVLQYEDGPLFAARPAGSATSS